MKKFALSALAVGLLASVAAVPAAEAQSPARPQLATTSCGTCVAPITCTEEDSCVLDYVGGNPGYWRARQSGGTVWVRLTMVNNQ